TGASSPYFTYHCTHANMQSRLDHVFAHGSHSHLSLDTQIRPFTGSDHSAVVVSFREQSSSPRHLLPRLNTHYLSYPDLQDSTIPLLLPYRSPMSWELAKITARSHAQDFAFSASRQRHGQLRFLERGLAQARRRSASAPDGSPAHLMAAEFHQRLQTTVTDAASRAVLRARVNWLEEGETCSAYFFSRFRNSRTTSTTSLLRQSDGSPFPSTDARRQHIASYYSAIYAAPTFDFPACDSFLASIPFPQLSASHISSLLAPFTADELAATIRNLPLRSSPGPDGLPYEWYQTFAKPLIPILLPLFNAVLSGSSPPPSWSQTLVSLIPKPNRDLSSISNWRPITLSNCDVKIYSRMLTSRLALVIPDLVAPNQAGFIKGRQAADIAQVLRSILAYAADNPIDGALVFLDQ